VAEFFLVFITCKTRAVSFHHEVTLREKSARIRKALKRRYLALYFVLYQRTFGMAAYQTLRFFHHFKTIIAKKKKKLQTPRPNVGCLVFVAQRSNLQSENQFR
jgi:hypothetical protein